MLLMSAGMKLSANDQMVANLTAAGLGKLITLIGAIELISVVLLLIPKTYKLGFFLINGYLGGALCIELAGGAPPVAAALLAVIWIGVFLRDRHLFLPAAQTASVSK
jgi:hypothetical protein